MLRLVTQHVVPVILIGDSLEGLGELLEVLVINAPGAFGELAQEEAVRLTHAAPAQM